MRIGLITGEYPPMQGGIGDYTQKLARALTAQGHEIHVLTNRSGGEFDDGISVSPVVKLWGMDVLNKAHDWSKYLDIVNIQYQTAAYAMSPWIHALPGALKVPTVTTFHDLRVPYLFPKAGKLRSWAVMRLARSSHGVIATNHEDMETLKQLPHSVLIPLGSNIEAESGPPFRSHLMRALEMTDDFLIGYFGFLNSSKGVDHLLDAIAIVRARGIPAHLIMIGGRVGASDPTNTAYAAAVDQQAERLGLTSVIHATGFAQESEIAAHLAACHVIALPFTDGASYRRGTLMAALHAGSATITTTPHIPIESFVDGVNLRLVPPGNAEALADSIDELYANSNLRERLKVGAHALSQQFNWANIAQSIINFYQQVIKDA